MSPEIIVGLVALTLLGLVSIAITIQTVEKNNKEKQRLENALSARARTFEHMLSGLPEGLLSNDLKLLVCKCMTEVSEQLSQLQPKKKEYAHQLQHAKTRTDEVMALGNSKAATPELRDHIQIKEIQKQLTSLFNFIARLRAADRINDQQAQTYALQIRRLMLKTSMDLHNEQARQATQQGKLRLAIHHYQRAVEKIKKENEAEFFNQHLQSYSERIQTLEKQDAERQEKQQARVDRNKDAWDAALNEDNDDWKKKTVYD